MMDVHTILLLVGTLYKIIIDTIKSPVNKLDTTSVSNEDAFVTVSAAPIIETLH